MKKILLLALITLGLSSGYSQEKSKFRVGLDLGFVPAGGGAGMLFSIEPKYNLTDNSNVGLRISVAGIARDIESNYDDSVSAKISSSVSFVGTYDYYFHKSGSSFAPYIGGGIGHYSVSNIETEDTAESENITPSVTGIFGGLVRAGFEWRKFRMGLEYNLLPKSDLENTYGRKVGEASNSYLGIHLGVYLGGGKWKK